MRFFLPPSGLGLEPGSPCPVIWARSPGPAHTLQLTQATPVGSGLRHGYSGSDCRGPSSQADGASSGPGPFPPTQSIQPLTVGPTVSIHLDLPQVCLLQFRAKRMSHTVPLHRDPAFLGSEPSGPRACCLCGQPILESKGGPATRQGLGWLCALKGVGPPVLPVYSDTFW